MPLSVTDTRLLFRPLCADITTLFHSLNDDDWLRPTVAGSWRVRDVAAHMLDTALRRLSFHRDKLAVPGKPPATDRELAALVNGLNASWVQVATRLSPSVMTDLYNLASTSLADFMESLDLHARARIPVSWAGQTESSQWLDIGREFTEIWHHGSQIRDAAGRGPFGEARWLRAVLEIAMHALPAAYRDQAAHDGASLVVQVTGPSGGTWTLTRNVAHWDIDAEPRERATTKVTLSDQTAWRLLFNALAGRDLEPLVAVEGERTLALPLLNTRAIVI